MGSTAAPGATRTQHGGRVSPLVLRRPSPGRPRAGDLTKVTRAHERGPEIRENVVTGPVTLTRP